MNFNVHNLFLIKFVENNKKKKKIYTNASQEGRGGPT